MFLSSNPDVRCQIDLKLLIRLNNMELLIFNCFLTYKAAGNRVTSALSGLKPLQERKVGERGPDGWSVQVLCGKRCPVKIWNRQVKGSLLACTGKGQLFCLHEAKFMLVYLNGSSLGPPPQTGLHGS